MSITGVEEAEAKELEDRAAGVSSALTSSSPASVLRKSPQKRKKARKYSTRIQLYSYTICATVDRRSGVDLDTSVMDTIDSLQQRVVLLLGRLGGKNKGVVGSVEAQLRRSQSWNNAPVLMMAFPLGTEKVNVYLDALFPVVAEVAEESSNRQTKVVACELLHAMTLHLIGASSSDPGHRGDVLFADRMLRVLKAASLCGACLSRQRWRARRPPHAVRAAVPAVVPRRAAPGCGRGARRAAAVRAPGPAACAVVLHLFQGGTTGDHGAAGRDCGGDVGP